MLRDTTYRVVIHCFLHKLHQAVPCRLALGVLCLAAQAQQYPVPEDAVAFERVAAVHQRRLQHGWFTALPKRIAVFAGSFGPRRRSSAPQSLAAGAHAPSIITNFGPLAGASRVSNSATLISVSAFFSLPSLGKRRFPPRSRSWA